MTRPILTKDALREAVKYYLDHDDITFDTETKGEYRLDPRRNQVFWISLAAQGRADVIPFGHPIGRQIGTTKEPRVGQDGKTRMFTVPVYDEPPEQLWPGDVFEILEPLFFERDNDQRLWAHNAKFDLESVAKYYDGDHPLGPYGDTSVAVHLMNENQHSYRLGDIVKRDYGITLDKSIGKEVEKYPFKLAAKYGFLDAKYTHLIGRKYAGMLQRAGLWKLFQLEMDLIGPLCRMEDAGSPPVDIDALRSLDADLDHQLTEITGDLYRLAGRQWNFNSNPQKVEVFYGRKRDGGQGLRPMKHTGTGASSCDKEALEHHVGNELVDVFAEYGELHKISSTYVKSYLGTNEKRNKDKTKNNAPPYNEDTGRIHTNFKQAGTVTGRFSCVSGSTLLKTNRGVFSFEDYLPVPGDRVMTHTGRWMPVVRKIYKGLAPMYRVRSSGDFGAVECTAEHRLLTPGGWTRVGLLGVGDEVNVYVGFDGVRERSGERAIGAGGVPRRAETDGASDGRGSGYALAQRAGDPRGAPARGEVQGREGAALLTLEVGRAEPYAGQEWFLAPQPQGGRGGWGWVSATEGAGEIRPRTSDCDGRGDWDRPARSSVNDDGSSRRREQTQQRLEQPGALHSYSAPTFAPSRITEIVSLGEMGVWDIEVAGDHSYLSQGFVHHNSSEPNVQNIPRPDTELGQRIRGLFVAAPGEKLIVADWSQVEYRILAYYSNDKRLIKAFEEGLDFHQYVASLLLAKSMEDVSKVERTVSKNTNFAVAYGASSAKVASMSGVTIDAAEEFLYVHKKMLPGMYAFCDEVVRRCRSRRPPYVTTLLGRKRRLPDINLPNNRNNFGRRKAAERQAVNCFDAETEALTQRGWVRGFDLRADDRFLTKNADTGVLEWRPSVHRWFYPDYDGPMVRVSNGRNLDVWTTPAHRWLVREKRTGSNVVKTSAQLAALAPKQSDFAVHMQGEYSQPWSVYSDDFASLLGWVLTDGYFGVTFVGIAQTKERQRKEIEVLLTRMGLRHSVYEPGEGKSAQYKIHGVVAAQIKALCPDKTLTPMALLGMGDTARAALFEAMMLGDGTDGPRQTTFAAGSEARTDAFQFLCTLLGKSSTKAFREYPVPAVNGRTGCWVVQVNRRTTAQMAHCESVERMQGGVWCVTVPNSFAVFRRRGSTFVSGNSVIQGSAADLMKLAIVREDALLVPGVIMNFTVHDELVTSVKEDQVDEGIQIVTEAMMGWEIAKLIHPVRLEADIKVVDRWSDAKG